jgi:hypothetical protein
VALILVTETAPRVRYLRQIEVCDRDDEAVIDREWNPGFEIFDRRDWR